MTSPENFGQQFDFLDRNVVDKPAFVSDAEGQEYNRQKLIQRMAFRGHPNVMRSERIWWHTQPKPPETTVERGVTVINPRYYLIHGSEAHVKTLTNGQPVSPYEEPLGPKFLHVSPPTAYQDIVKNGLKPSVTASSGHDSRRFGVFLSRKANEVNTSGSIGKGGDVWSVNVPKEDLREGPDGDLYVERRIRPSEIQHVGHVCKGYTPAPGRAATCKEGH